MNGFFLASALFIGVLLAVQASVNLQLNKAAGTPYGAAAVQLTVAAVLLAMVTTATGGLGALTLLSGVEPWKLLGGIASPIYITSAILLLPRLGALASVGLFVTGQMLVSLVIDYGGLLGVDSRRITFGSIVGALLVISGIAVIVHSRVKASGWIVLGLIAGGVLPIQAAINASLNADLGQSFAVALTSFVVATAVIYVGFAAMRLTGRTSALKLGGLSTMPWWGWLGGAAAATYVTVTFLLVPAIGAATTVALTVTGQQIASAAIDHYGFFRLDQRRLVSARLAGLLLLILGSLMVRFS